MNERLGLRCCHAAMVFLLACLSLPSLSLPLFAAAEETLTASRLPTGSTAPEAPSTNASLSTNVSPGIHATYEAMDQLRRDMEQSAARNAEAINSGLSLIEPTLARMHERQMEAVQSSNRTILLAAGVFAAVGFFGLIFISLILVRAIGRFSELAVANAPRALLGPGSVVRVPVLGEGGPSGPGAAEQATGRFQGAIEQLQRRIQELEHELHDSSPKNLLAAHAAPASSPHSDHTIQASPDASNIQELRPSPEPPSSSRASVLLGKGQALLSLDAPEQALACFEESLTLDPNNADAMVKRGMAFEKLQDWEQALESYNRAIAADSTLTVAYLYRGGVCNRLQRYREALESYEEALRTEKKSRAS